MKKLCFITTIPGTLEAFVLDTAEYLYETEKYDITFICDNDEKFADELPEYIRYIPVSMKRGISLSGVKAVIKLWKIFKEEKFDYIQYSTPNASFYCSIASWLSKSPVRVYAQWGIRYAGSRGIGRCILKFLEKCTCKLSTHIRAVSLKNKDFAISEKLYSKNKAKVIGNGGTVGVDLKEFDISKKEFLREELRAEYNISEGETVFGFVGRMSRDKGSDELLHAFKEICKKGYKAKLFIIGNIENISSIDETIISWAKKSSNVIFTGRILKAELIKFYSVFDCYVHPTYREGFGMVLQEAGAMGNAIITTDIPGASEVMEKDVSCKLVKVKDMENLREAMEYIINNREKAEEIGKQAYKRTVELYERSIMLNNIKKDIEEILEESR